MTIIQNGLLDAAMAEACPGLNFTSVKGLASRVGMNELPKMRRPD